MPRKGHVGHVHPTPYPQRATRKGHPTLSDRVIVKIERKGKIQREIWRPFLSNWIRKTVPISNICGQINGNYLHLWKASFIPNTSSGDLLAAWISWGTCMLKMPLPSPGLPLSIFVCWRSTVKTIGDWPVTVVMCRYEILTNFNEFQLMTTQTRRFYRILGLCVWFLTQIFDRRGAEKSS